MKQPLISPKFAAGIALLAAPATATLILSELQPVAGFSRSCTAAYNIPIRACPDAQTFINAEATTGCDRQCFEALNGVSVVIQSACQPSAADDATVISHAFIGDLSVFLCGKEFADGSNTETATNFLADPTSPLISKISSSTPPASTSSAQTSATGQNISPSAIPTFTGTLISKSRSSSFTTTSTTMMTTTSTTQSTTQAPTTRTTSISSSTATSSTSSSTSARPSTTRFDSTPFDQGVPSVSPASSSSLFGKAQAVQNLLVKSLVLTVPWFLFS